MNHAKLLCRGLSAIGLLTITFPAAAQSFLVQCPQVTPNPIPPLTASGVTIPAGRTWCQQISGGDGFVTMADGTQMYIFGFGGLSGLSNIIKGGSGTVLAPVFNQNSNDNSEYFYIGAPSPLLPDSSDYDYNGAVGMVPDPDPDGDYGCPEGGSIAGGNCLDGHVDPRLLMDLGTLSASFPAPAFALEEDAEFFLTLSNTGQIMRPDLFEQHTVHFHGYPNASSFYDGVPDASVAINIGGSFTYYYLAPDAGTYLWHCHITPPEHLELGMVGQAYVHARQDRLDAGVSLYNALMAQQTDPRTKCDGPLCTNPLPAINTGATKVAGERYVYNDGDGSTAYDVEYPINLHGFDPNFHFVGMTFNPESFIDLKAKYFMLNGRSYPDTINSEAISTQGPDGVERYSQPMRSLINIPLGGRALLRLSDLNVTEFHTLASLGIPMHVVGINAKLLRDDDGNNMDYYTNSITLGGGESIDVILDASDTSQFPANSTYYLYTPQLDHLSNDAENFGGMMTEVHILSCSTASFDQVTKECTGI